jgi:hypothetical protein
MVVADCGVCGAPVVVAKVHSEMPACRVVERMVRVAGRLFPGGRLDFRAKEVPGHFHFHVR